MADMDKDRLKELEIESILEETHYLADQERMEQTAQKYRAKPKIEEIFSNADKKPRLKNTNPLDESEPDTSNSIVGDKTAATMQAELIMDGNDDDLVTPEQLKAEAEKKAAEKAEKAKEKVYRKRFINKMVEHVGTTVLQEDGKAVGKKAERGEYFIARVNKVWGNVMGRYPSGNDNPYNDEKSKSPIGNLRIVKGLEASEIDKMAEHDRRKSKEMSFSNAAEAERN